MVKQPSNGAGLDTVAILLLLVGTFSMATFMLGRAEAAQSAYEADIAQARQEGRVLDIPLEGAEDWPDWKEGE